MRCSYKIKMTKKKLRIFATIIYKKILCTMKWNRTSSSVMIGMKVNKKKSIKKYKSYELLFYNLLPWNYLHKNLKNNCCIKRERNWSNLLREDLFSILLENLIIALHLARYQNCDTIPRPSTSKRYLHFDESNFDFGNAEISLRLFWS